MLDDFRLGFLRGWLQVGFRLVQAWARSFGARAKVQLALSRRIVHLSCQSLRREGSVYHFKKTKSKQVACLCRVGCRKYLSFGYPAALYSTEATHSRKTSLVSGCGWCCMGLVDIGLVSGWRRLWV